MIQLNIRGLSALFQASSPLLSYHRFTRTSPKHETEWILADWKELLMSEENRDSGIEAQPNERFDKTKVRLSPPWGNIQTGTFIGDGKATGEFLRGRKEVHSTYIREEWKTKRLSLILAAILALAACIVVGAIVKSGVWRRGKGEVYPAGWG
jgi:hypothetical protein